MIHGINSSTIHQSNNIAQNRQTQTTETQKSESVSRVDELKKQIESGEYKVDIQKTAQALAETLI
jgi:anti-sigma28 factor (negative regulator of flagellin synthesis)